MLDKNNNFFDQWYFVCGASSGIGFAVAEALAKAGAKLILLSRSIDRLQSARDQLLDSGAKEVECLAYDLSNIESLSTLGEAVGNKSIRGLFLNGGGPSGISALDCDPKTLQAAHNLLTAGPFEVVRQLLPKLQRPKGVIISNGSGTLFEIQDQLVLSGAYRRALETLLKTLAHEVGPEGIRVLTLAPGYINTKRLNELVDKLVVSKITNAEKDKIWQGWAEGSALQRVGEAHEVAQACLYLFSDQATFFTGQTIRCDGGFIKGY